MFENALFEKELDPHGTCVQFVYISMYDYSCRDGKDDAVIKKVIAAELDRRLGLDDKKKVSLLVQVLASIQMGIYIFVSHEHFIQERLFIIFSEKLAKDPTRYWVLAIRRKGEGFCLILELSGFFPALHIP